MTEGKWKDILTEAKLKYCGSQGVVMVDGNKIAPFWVQDKYGNITDAAEPVDELPGGSTPSQYALPEGAKELQDLIEYRQMNYALGNIFKACYRLGHCNHSDTMRDLRKIKWFVERLIKQEDNNG